MAMFVMLVVRQSCKISYSRTFRTLPYDVLAALCTVQSVRTGRGIRVTVH